MERSLFMGEFTLTSGASSSFYVDCRQTTMSAEGQSLVGRLGFEAIKASDPEVRWVGGLTLGADPISYAIAHRSWIEGDPVDAFTVRKQPKTHGTGQRIEGGVPSAVPVVVVEDTLTTGASALAAIQVLKEHEAIVTGVLALVDRGTGAAAAIQDAGYPLTILFTVAELLEAAGQLDRGVS